MDSSSNSPDPALIKTLTQLFLWRVESSGKTDAVIFHHDGKFVSLSWEALAEKVHSAAALLNQLGIRPGDHVVQVSENRHEWLVFDLAIQMAGAVHVPIHATLAPAQIAYQLSDSGARVAVLSKSEMYESLLAFSADFPHCTEWIFFDALPAVASPSSVHLWAEMADLQRDRDETATAERGQLVAASDLATILYTSGTTGNPKGVMLTHRNLIANTLSLIAANKQEPEDLRLSLLPWSHIFARTCDIYTWIASGCRLAIAEDREKFLDNCRDLKPTLLNAVPYFYDKLYRILMDQGLDQTPGSLQKLLGGKIRVCGSGGAALPCYAETLFAEQGLPLLPGYGLTETSPVITTCTLTARQSGSVGQALRDVEIRISDDGEILTRGPHVMKGYYKNQAATEEVIRNGWLHTGDLGTLSSDGYLTITGRKKEMIVLATGKNISPTILESRLTSDLLIFQAMVLGDEQNYITALIVPSAEILRGEITRQGLRVHSAQDALVHPDVLSMYRNTIDRCLKDLAAYEQIRKFRLLDRPFSVDREELTPTLKLRRNVILNNFTDVITEMYAE